LEKGLTDTPLSAIVLIMNYKSTTTDQPSTPDNGDTDL